MATGISSSAIFRQFIADQLSGNVGGTGNASFVSLNNASGFRVALYGAASNTQSVAPDKDAIAGSTGNVSNWGAASSAWTSGGSTAGAATSAAPEVYNTGWGQGGLGLGSPAVTPVAAGTGAAGSGIIMFDGADTASTTTTLSNVYGSLIYVASTASGTVPTATSTALLNRGVCYNYFGGANGVTAGVLTVVWNNNGIFRITV